MFTVKKATHDDLPIMEEIFKCAREYMKNTGNPTQWGTSGPSIFLVKRDIERDVSYLVYNDNVPVGTFSYTLGEEPTYKVIKGAWLNDNPYGAMHRNASNGKAKGVFEFCFNYCLNFGVDIRIDTHENNATMRHLIEKVGCTYCGIITTDDGTPRLAYQKEVN